MSAHAFLPPSGANIWHACAAAPSMWQIYPEDEESEHSREGVAAHWVFAEIFAGRPVESGAAAINGVAVTDEMVEGANLFVDTVTSTRLLPPNLWPDLYIERTISTGERISPDCWGTPDCWGWNVAEKILYLWDYKFGHGYIDVFGNWQLLCYAAAALFALGVDGYTEQQVTVKFCIVQPRNYCAEGPVRTWVVNAAELRGLYNTLAAAAERAKAPNPAATVNPNCGHCSARHACATLQRAAWSAADLSTQEQPLNMTPEARALELRMLRRAQATLEARVSGVEEQMTSELKRGRGVAGFLLEQGRGRTQFAPDKLEHVLELGRMFNIELQKSGLVTPNQAVKAGLPAEMLDGLTVTSPGQIKLIEDNGQKARKIFS